MGTSQRPGDPVRAPTGRRLAALPSASLGVLQALGATRFLEAGQVTRLAKTPHDRAVRALRTAGLVQRFPFRPDPDAPRRFVYALTPAGERAYRALRSHALGEGGAWDPAVLHSRHGAPASAPDAVTLSYLFVAHHLAVSELYVRLVREVADDGPIVWRTGPEARFTFRSFLRREGTAALVPDAVVGLGPDALAGIPHAAVAVEVDRATMGRRAIDGKLVRYKEWFAVAGVRWPLLFVSDDAARRRWLTQRLSEHRLEGAAADLDGAVAWLRLWLGTQAADGQRTPPL